MASEATYIIESAVLIVPKLTINPELILSHLDMLKQQPAMYSFQKYASRVHTIPQENRDVIENLFSDKVPSLVIVVLISSADFSGSYTLVKTRTGELRLRVEFSEGLPNAVNMLILGRFPAKFYINESKVVSYDMFQRNLVTHLIP